MAVFQVFKETALPGSLVANAMYVVAPAANPDYIEIYVTNNAGTVARRTPRISDINFLISSALADYDKSFVVADITARNAIASPKTGWMAWVIDASADSTVTSGAAQYVYNETGSVWIKTSEAESMDVTVAWADITGKPSSSVANIDDAVTKRHTHTNKTQLDKIGEDGSGYLTYDGDLPSIAWQSTAW